MCMTIIFCQVKDCSKRWRLQREKRVQVRPRRRLRREGSRTARGKRPPETEIYRVDYQI